jgi:hypothetical protein
MWLIALAIFIMALALALGLLWKTLYGAKQAAASYERHGLKVGNKRNVLHPFQQFHMAQIIVTLIMITPYCVIHGYHKK